MTLVISRVGESGESFEPDTSGNYDMNEIYNFLMTEGPEEIDFEDIENVVYSGDEINTGEWEAYLC